VGCTIDKERGGEMESAPMSVSGGLKVSVDVEMARVKGLCVLMYLSNR
jgi:hypothetical protein